MSSAAARARGEVFVCLNCARKIARLIRRRRRDAWLGVAPGWCPPCPRRPSLRARAAPVADTPGLLKASQPLHRRAAFASSTAAASEEAGLRRRRGAPHARAHRVRATVSIFVAAAASDRRAASLGWPSRASCARRAQRRARPPPGEWRPARCARRVRAAGCRTPVPESGERDGGAGSAWRRRSRRERRGGGPRAAAPRSQSAERRRHRLAGVAGQRRSAAPGRPRDQVALEHEAELTSHAARAGSHGASAGRAPRRAADEEARTPGRRTLNPSRADSLRVAASRMASTNPCSAPVAATTDAIAASALARTASAASSPSATPAAPASVASAWSVSPAYAANQRLPR